MKAPYRDTSRIFLIVAMTVGSLVAQTGATKSAAKEVPVPPKPLNNHFTIAYPESTRTWQISGSNVTSSSVSQAVANALAQKLAQKHFTRVQTLDTQCCSLQLEVIGLSSALSVRISVLDIDKQSVYVKEYRAELAAKPTGSSPNINTAASGVVEMALSDPNFVRALAGT